jgi:phosphoribosylformylglycinamidine synthase
VIKGKVIVQLKPEVSDPEGMTIQQTVAKLGYAAVKHVRTGRFFEVDLDTDDKQAARKQLEGLCDRILANPIIENFRFELEELSS